MLSHVRVLSTTISEHLSSGSDMRRELDALVAKLRAGYEDLAAVLRASDCELPALRPANFKRNAFHVASATFAATLIVLLVPYPWALVGVAIAFAGVCWTLELLRRGRPDLNERLMHLFRHISHPHEAHQVNSSTWYATALVILALTHEPRLCLVGVTVLGLADPAAAIVGRRFGRLKLVNGRTLEGSLTFALVGALSAFAALSSLSGWIFEAASGWELAAASVFGAVFGAVAELFSGRRVDDNMSIPLASALGAWLAFWLF